MQIEILTPVSVKNPKNAYVLFVKFMHGDADAYSTEEYGPYKADDEFELKGLEETLKALAEVIERDGISDPEEYEEIPGYTQYLEPNWPADSTCDDYLAQYEAHYVRFFDANGIEHQTKVTL